MSINNPTGNNGQSNGKVSPCGAKNQSGQPCNNPGSGAGGRCRYHGGNSVSGVASGTFKHGRYAKYLGPRWAEAYEDSLNDSDGLFDLTETLAILDTIVKRCAKRVEDRDTPDFRSRAMDLFDLARAATDPEDAASLLTELGKLLKRGASEDAAFRGLAKATDTMARRSEGAWKVRLTAATAINAADLTGVLARVVSVLREEIHDRSVREQVLRRLTSEVMAGRTEHSGPGHLPGPNGSNGSVAD